MISTCVQAPGQDRRGAVGRFILKVKYALSEDNKTPAAASPVSNGRAGSIIPLQTVAGQIPSTISASSGPGQGGIVTPTASIGSSPSTRNWNRVPAGIASDRPGSI